LKPPHQRPDSPDFEELLADCIRLLSTGGSAALEPHLAEYPDQATNLRARLATLQRLGMLGGIEGDEQGPQARIGPYVIQRTLGHGGMSRVYLALHEHSDTLVALKVLHSPLLDDSRAHLRFEREVVAVSSLSHPCIVAVHESGVHDRQPWLAMEYVEGATLDQILEELREGEISFEELEGAHVRGIAQRESSRAPGAKPDRGYVESVCRIVLDIAAALQHAHHFGIIHRDVKPANIVVNLDGRAKLLDLGLASLEGSPSLTRTGDFAGTPYYVAPEQARSAGSADHRSDVFSLGVTLYEALTLKRPFEGRDAAEVFRNLQVCDPLPPGKHNPLLPRDLETICLRALEKDPSQRYGSMAELTTDLQRFLEFRPIVARPVGRTRRVLRIARRRPTLSLLVAVLTLIVVTAPIVLVLVNEAIRDERDVAQANAIEAERQARIAEAVVDHLVELFSPPTEVTGTDLNWGWEEMLAASVERIPTELEQDPLLRAALLEAAGRIHANLERYEQGVPLLDRAYALRQRQLQDGHPGLATTLVWLAGAHLDAGNPQAARSLAARGLEALESRQEDRYREATFDLRYLLARATRDCEDSEQALKELRRLEELSSDPLGGLAHRRVQVDLALADLLLEQDQLTLALEYCERALLGLRQAWVPDARELTSTLRLRGRILTRRGEEVAAARSRSEADALSRVFEDAQLGLAGELWLESFPYSLEPSWGEEYDAAFQRGITALQSKRTSEAIVAFEECLKLAPGHAVCLYNLACAHALAGELDESFDRLQQAHEHGYGLLQGSLLALSQDPDLSPLRGDPRFDELKRRMSRSLSLAYNRNSAPRIHLPAAAEDTGALLVVLSGDRSESSADSFERWRAVAETSGAYLLYIDGLMSGEPSAWIAEIDNFLDDPWGVEESAATSIRTFAREHGLEPDRTILIGEGSGSPVAFDLALRAPGFFGAAMLLDGVALPSPDATALALARACDSKVRLLIGELAALPQAFSNVPRTELAQGMQDWMRAGGLDASAENLPGLATDLSADRLRAELRLLWQAPQKRGK
jgi:serine/threonine protein kinase/tetratricopeptide (TPR) repeat protein